ncbi:MAG: hypothetical protein PHO32_07900 [Candidatus Cloacimonetes bacterium]|nr:hypothetical protein [Candidatus Cloacimonadota bacterium]
MCSQKLIYLSSVPRLHRSEGIHSRKVYAVALLVFLFSLVLSNAYSQKLSDDYLAAKNWVLPQGAVLFSEIITDNDIHLHQGKPFTGTAQERYPNGQLLRAVSYINGKQSGLMLLWYPDGTPQMSASYKDGYLHGRFLGWYQNGGIIYDMMINKGTYAGDILSESDESRVGTESIETESEGPDNDQSPE